MDVSSEVSLASRTSRAAVLAAAGNANGPNDLAAMRQAVSDAVNGLSGEIDAELADEIIGTVLVTISSSESDPARDSGTPQADVLAWERLGELVRRLVHSRSALAGHSDSRSISRQNRTPEEVAALLRLLQVPWTALTVQHELGRGGQATVFAALFAGREVAVKLIKRPTSDREARELRYSFALSHPHIIRPIAHTRRRDDTPGSKDAIILPRLARMLADVIHADPQSASWTPPSDETKLRLSLELASAVAYLHTCDPPVYHSDIKPGNVMLDAEGRAVLIDFGLAYGATTTATTSAPGFTEVYADPELPERGERCDGASDVFSLCLVLWEVWNSCEWFADLPDGVRSAARHLRRRGDLPACRATIPPRVAALIARGCSYDAAARCTAPQLLAALRAININGDAQDAEPRATTKSKPRQHTQPRQSHQQADDSHVPHSRPRDPPDARPAAATTNWNVSLQFQRSENNAFQPVPRERAAAVLPREAVVSPVASQPTSAKHFVRDSVSPPAPPSQAASDAQPATTAAPVTDRDSLAAPRPPSPAAVDLPVRPSFSAAPHDDFRVGLQQRSVWNRMFGGTEPSRQLVMPETPMQAAARTAGGNIFTGWGTTVGNTTFGFMQPSTDQPGQFDIARVQVRQPQPSLNLGTLNFNNNFP